ncbi:hypothetical protein [Lentilactobacillus senioris]|uniref:hypothetical protein n=1 Tax=Lentilactobacillus senioris TaxID=931534 RepID=UPI003D2D8F69
MSKNIYQVVRTYGMYSDYTEEVIGVTDNLQTAKEYADRYVYDNPIMEDEDRYSVFFTRDENGKLEESWENPGDNSVYIQAYVLNQYDPEESYAEIFVRGESRSNLLLVWETEFDDDKWHWQKKEHTDEKDMEG